MNTVILIGRLARDVELRSTSTNINVANFTLAVSRPYVKDKEQETDFINCVVWGNKADNLAKYCHKGNQIAVEGRIQTRNYTSQDGSKRYITETLCESITFLGNVNKQEQKTIGEEVLEDVVNNMVKQSDTQSDTQKDPFAEFGEEVIINDDDLPFD